MPRRAERRAARPGFAADRRGLSAVEFACCAPVFILLLVGGADMIRYIIACDRVEAIANATSLMLAQNASGLVTYQDVQFYKDSAMVTYPALLSEAAARGVLWSSRISISLASVTFTTDSGCLSNCTYTPQVVWTGGDVPRACTGTISQAPDDAPPTPTTLPVHVFAPGTIIVADVSYTLAPLFQSRLFNGITVKRSAYATARLTPLIKYQVVPGDNGIAQPCPGYAS